MKPLPQRYMASIEKNANLVAKETVLHLLYQIALNFIRLFLPLAALVNPKIRKFVKGRKGVWKILQESIPKDREVIWIHAASLGEFEQGLPVMEKLKTGYKDHILLLSFFSPSGYEVRKNTKAADVVCYLPLDTSGNVKRFLQLARPVLAVFIKYEIWPNYLRGLQENRVPAVLISAIFSPGQVYFKWYGGFMRRALKRFTRIFVQNNRSRELLMEIGLESSISGDTRFDRVAYIREQGTELQFMEDLTRGRTCLVAGSTWPADEEVLLDMINSGPTRMCTVIAPHDIKDDHLRQLQSKLNRPCILHSQIKDHALDGIEVLIIDSVGLLTRIYRYADIAYVGGGFATGLHNTLEPAVFGIPVIIGPKYHKFQEAIDLVHRKGILVVRNSEEFIEIMGKLLVDEDFRANTGLINSNYISGKIGASLQIMDYLRTLL